MTEIERELRALRAQVDGMRVRQRRLVAVLGSITLAGAVGAILASRPALSDPGSPFACGGHPSQVYCFTKDTPAQASQVNSNFEAAFQGLDGKLDKTDAGDVTVQNLTVNGTVSLGEYNRSSSGGGGGATAYCDPADFVLGGQAYCPAGSSLLAAGSTYYSGNLSWGYYGTCTGLATVNVIVYCAKKLRQ
jgi:hypothetical protein